MNKRLLQFVAHKWNCDALQPMWHKGPCNCGLYALFDDMRTIGLSAHPYNVSQLISLFELLVTCPDLMNDWQTSRKFKFPTELYRCLRCKNPIAEKQPDIQGWNGFCHYCGMIAQSQVGELAFSSTEPQSIYADLMDRAAKSIITQEKLVAIRERLQKMKDAPQMWAFTREAFVSQIVSLLEQVNVPRYNTFSQRIFGRPFSVSAYNVQDPIEDTWACNVIDEAYRFLQQVEVTHVNPPKE